MLRTEFLTFENAATKWVTVRLKSGPAERIASDLETNYGKSRMFSNTQN